MLIDVKKLTDEEASCLSNATVKYNEANKSLMLIQEDISKKYLKESGKSIRCSIIKNNFILLFDYLEDTISTKYDIGTK